MPAGHPTRFAFMSGGTDFMRGDRWLSGRIAAMVACSHFNAQQNYARFRRGGWRDLQWRRYQPFPAGTTRCRSGGWRSVFAEGDVVFVFAGRVIGLKGLHRRSGTG